MSLLTKEPNGSFSKNWSMLVVYYALVTSSTLIVAYVLFALSQFDNNNVNFVSAYFDKEISFFPQQHSSVAFYRSLCSKFSEVAKCPKLLETKGTRHKLPELDLIKRNHLDLRRVLLVVHFNNQLYSPAPLVDAIYRPLFGKIIYCGPSDDDKLFRQQWLTHQPTASIGAIDFLSYGIHQYDHEINAYWCLPLLILSEKYRAIADAFEGVLLVSDDVVLNYWNWWPPEMSLIDKIWALGIIDDSPFDIITGKFCGVNRNSTWPWPSRNKKEIIRFYDDLTSLANGSLKVDSVIASYSGRNSSQMQNYWGEIKANITKVTRGEQRLLGLYNGDMLYVARRFMPNIVPLLDLMGRHRIFMEIAVGTAVRAVASLDEIYQISWAGEDVGLGHIRSHPFIDVYATNYTIVHPFKLNKVSRSLRKSKSRIGSNDRSPACVYCNLVNFASVYTNALYPGDK